MYVIDLRFGVSSMPKILKRNRLNFVNSGLSLHVAFCFDLGESGRLPLCITYMSNCVNIG